MLEHTMLVANLLFFLRRIVLEGLSRTQNNLEILAGDFKLGRWQKGLLGCCDHFVNPAASFFADVDSSHQGGQIFVSASRRTVYETLSIDQRTAGIEDLDSVFENLQHRTSAAESFDAAILDSNGFLAKARDKKRSLSWASFSTACVGVCLATMSVLFDG